ncbi:hypothetical protein GGD63_006290 [Bradyrhizobium sp. cir1]|uniref:hypothetical protein n=1 Tax=Bradyrhizobium sp. cir1 TaxID=1445730 RepID=UPI001606C2C3|nr:hypothetical protein [Bradyrhizobium sp. cir1]MBB4373467.1 hypothetical protein [Bradyrhizobium sp. cir1]
MAEISYFVHSTDSSGDLHPFHHLVWTKVAYALGFVHLNQTGFDADTELAIQKAFFDKMWDMRLEDVMKTLGGQTSPDGLDFNVSGLNEGVIQNADQLRSFAQAYEAELRGSVEPGANVAMDVIGDLFRKRTGQLPPDKTTDLWQKLWKQWANLFFLARRKRPLIREQLRTLHINAALHAAFRWDKARRFTSNDLYDFEHASAALAYCRAFFAEDGLHARHLALDRLFQCHVASDIPGAIALLDAIERTDAATELATASA